MLPLVSTIGFAISSAHMPRAATQKVSPVVDRQQDLRFQQTASAWLVAHVPGPNSPPPGWHAIDTGGVGGGQAGTVCTGQPGVWQMTTCEGQITCSDWQMIAIDGWQMICCDW